MSQSQQGRESASLVEQTREPRRVPGLGECRASAPVAGQKSRLLETLRQSPGYVTRSLPGASSSKHGAYKNDFSPTVTRFRRVARSSAAGTYRPFGGLTVTRGRGASRPAPATKGPKHSGHEVRNETERQYVCR